MRCRIPFICLTLCSLLVLGMSTRALADASAKLEQAELLMNTWQYEQAEAMYRQIVADYPDTDCALEAQKELVMLYLTWDKPTQGEAAFEELVAGFPEHPLLPEVLYYIVEEYAWSGKHEEATSFCQQIIQQYPGGPYADKAQLGVPAIKVLSLIDSGEDAAAQSALDSLISDFADHSGLPEVLYHIARRYKQSGKCEIAESLYKDIVANYPRTDYAFQAETRLVLWYISVARNDEAQAAIASLVADFSEHSELVKALYDIAKGYEQSAKYEEAETMYKDIMRRYPGTKYASRALLDIEKCPILLVIDEGDDVAAEAAIDALISHFSDHPDLPEVVFVIGEEYYNKAFEYENEGFEPEARDNFTKAIAVWERIIEEFPVNTPYTPHSYYFSAVCYRRLAQYQKAIEYYQEIVDNWANYQSAWSAQFLVADNYERLIDPDGVPDPQIVAQIKAACEQVLHKYPHCPAANAARDWLESNIDLIDLLEGGQK